MSHLGTQLTPLRIGAAVGKLNQVKGIINIRLQVIYRHMHTVGILVGVLILAGETHIQYGQSLGTNVLGEQEELIETQTIRLEVAGEEAVSKGIVPTVLVKRTVLYLSNRFLPLVA